MQTLSENCVELCEVDGKHQDKHDFSHSHHDKLCSSDSNNDYLDSVDVRVEKNVSKSKSKLQEQTRFDLNDTYSKLTNSSHLHKSSINFHNYEYLRSCASNEIDEEFYCEILDESVEQNILAKRVHTSRNIEKQKGSASYSLKKEVISSIVN